MYKREFVMRVTLDLPGPRFKVGDVVQLPDIQVKILGYSMVGGWKWSTEGVGAWVELLYTNPPTDANDADNLECYYGVEVLDTGDLLSLSMGEVDRIGETCIPATVRTEE
jgi:hypothetical protein